jgi:hypothetical protein
VIAASTLWDDTSVCQIRYPPNNNPEAVKPHE